MPRFFVPPEQLYDNHFTILGSEARHAAVVLRKKPGDVIELFDGKDLSYQGRIESISPDRVEGKLISESRQSSKNLPEIILCQALIKGPKWDWLVEKASEVGASQLIPILTARTIVKVTGSGAVERSKRIALAAAKQCGRSSVMDITEPQPFAEVLKTIPKDSKVLMPWEKEGTLSMSEAVSGIPGAANPLYIFIGPEGGWEEQEVELARRHGAISVSLGDHLLRSETAGLVALVLAKNIKGF